MKKCNYCEITSQGYQVERKLFLCDSCYEKFMRDHTVKKHPPDKMWKCLHPTCYQGQIKSRDGDSHKKKRKTPPA